MTLPFTVETRLEQTISTDPDWLQGVSWGEPRPGHPEGQVMFHIRDVLINVDRFFGASDQRTNLRLIALIHDTFKYQAKRAATETPRPTHGAVARAFAARYISDPGVLEVIELHDEAYKAWLLLSRHNDPTAAQQRAQALINRLGAHLSLFMQFYRCDHLTGDKSTAHYAWFQAIAGASSDE